MVRLSLKALKMMVPGEIIGKGQASINGSEIKWVAVKGHVVDWAIYYTTAVGSSYILVKDMGLKMISKKIIRSLVSCDDAAFKRYRY